MASVTIVVQLFVCLLKHIIKYYVIKFLDVFINDIFNPLLYVFLIVDSHYTKSDCKIAN